MQEVCTRIAIRDSKKLCLQRYWNMVYLWFSEGVETGFFALRNRDILFMTLRIITFLAFWAFSFTGLYAQKWAEMLHDGRANFYEIQEAFNTEWSGKDTVRGSGWKPYKRWEFNAEERVYPSGEFPPMHLRFTEY